MVLIALGTFNVSVKYLLSQKAVLLGTIADTSPPV